jgi:hypothetical protein
LHSYFIIWNLSESGRPLAHALFSGTCQLMSKPSLPKAPADQKAQAPLKSGIRKKKASPKTPSAPQHVDLLEFLCPLRTKHAEQFKVDGYELVRGDAKESKEQEKSFVATLAMMKGLLFKRDQPYRTTLPLQGNFVTGSSGAVNLTQSVLSLPSCSEWAAIDALFDEVFVHAMKFRYFPVNDLGAGVGTSASSSITGGITAIADSNIVNAPLNMVSLFGGSGAYSTASAMNANATLAVHSSGKPFTYTWRNNTKFSPHGLSMSTVASGLNTGWCGWTQISGVPYLGGLIQFRAIQDVIFGTGSAAVTLGLYLCQYDVSFRQRS